MATKKKKAAAARKSPSKTTARKGAAGRAARPRPAAPAKRKGKGAPPKRAVPGTGRRPKRATAPAAAPSVPAAPAAPAAPDTARPTALAIAHAGLDKKAEDVTVLDVRGLTSYADYFVVMTAESDRQAGAIADHVEQTMKAQGITKVGVEGYEGGRWILVDYGDVVAHVMNRESRGFYDLEGLWADAPRFTVEA
jgi:ribosome-associated protein